MKLQFMAVFLWLCSAAALGSWIAVMALDRRLPTRYLSTDETKLIPDPVEQGGRVTVYLPVQRTRTCPGTVTRWLLNTDTGQRLVTYDPVPALYPIGEYGIVVKTFELPEDLPPRVTYSAQVCFVCNVLQHFNPICTMTPDISFRVIQKPAAYVGPRP